MFKKDIVLPKNSNANAGELPSFNLREHLYNTASLPEDMHFNHIRLLVPSLDAYLSVLVTGCLVLLIIIFCAVLIPILFFFFKLSLVVVIPIVIIIGALFGVAILGKIIRLIFSKEKRT